MKIEPDANGIVPAWVLVTKERVNPYMPINLDGNKGFVLFKVLKANGKLTSALTPTVIITTPTPDDVLHIGAALLVRSREDNHVLGTYEVVGSIDFDSLATEGSVPDRTLARWQYR